MSDTRSVSTLLDAVQAGDSSAAAELWEHFHQRARDLARGRVSPQIQARVGVSDIVQEALKSALSLVRQGRLRNNHHEEFEAILATIIRRKAASAARKVASDNRMLANAPLRREGNVPQPDEELIRREDEALDEQAIREMTEFLFQQQDAMRSKHHAVKGLVRVLGIIHALDTAEISTLLREQFPESEPPRERTIELAVKAGWEMLRKEFGNDGRAQG